MTFTWQVLVSVYDYYKCKQYLGLKINLFYYCVSIQCTKLVYLCTFSRKNVYSSATSKVELDVHLRRFYRRYSAKVFISIITHKKVDFVPLPSSKTRYFQPKILATDNIGQGKTFLEIKLAVKESKIQRSLCQTFHCSIVRLIL